MSVVCTWFFMDFGRFLWLFKGVSRFYDYWLALMVFQGSFTFFHGFGQLFLVVFVQQYPIQAEQQQSKTLGTSQNVPT